MSDLIGYELGPYHIVAELGHGGMGNVYRAKQLSIGREVAIKVLPTHLLQDRTFLERFDREVKIIARLQHPHILPVHDYGQANNLPYIVMALVSGGTLAERILRSPSGLPLTEVARLAAQIADGMDYAHEQGIIHRDFKPSNVLLDPRGNVYLADFGIARVIADDSQLTGSGTVGTPAYMAPELSREGGLTHSVDIYALGVTLFEMLTGHHPYKADTPIGVMLAHATEPVPNILSIVPTLPPTIQGVIDLAMAKDPKRRYQTAGALAADLSQIAGVSFSKMAESATLPDPSTQRMTYPQTPEAVSKLKKPSRLVWWGFGGGLFLLFAVVMTMLLSSRFTDFGTTTAEPTTTLGITENMRFEGHSSGIMALAFSADSATLASASDDNSLILWDVRTGRHLRTLEGHNAPVYMVAFSPREPLLASGSEDSIILWDLRTGQLIQTLTGHADVICSLTFSEDGQTLVSASDDGILILWDVSTGDRLRTVQGGISSVNRVAFSPDGVTIASGTADGAVTLWDLRSDTPLFDLKEHNFSISDVDFSPDGMQVAAAAYNTIILWDVSTGERLHTFTEHDSSIRAIAFSPDGNLLASAQQNGEILIWDVATGYMLQSPPKQESWVNDLAFSPNGNLLASTSGEETIVLWNVNP